MTTGTPQGEETVTALNRLLVKALKALGRDGREHEACMLAAEGWSLLRRSSPREAERLNGLLHYLTAPPRKKVAPPEAARSRQGDDS